MSNISNVTIGGLKFNVQKEDRYPQFNEEHPDFRQFDFRDPENNKVFSIGIIKGACTLGIYNNVPDKNLQDRKIVWESFCPDPDRNREIKISVKYNGETKELSQEEILKAAEPMFECSKESDKPSNVAEENAGQTIPNKTVKAAQHDKCAGDLSNVLMKFTPLGVTTEDDINYVVAEANSKDGNCAFYSLSHALANVDIYLKKEETANLRKIAAEELVQDHLLQGLTSLNGEALDKEEYKALIKVVGTHEGNADKLMDVTDVKHYLKELIKDNMIVGMEIIKEN